VESLDGPTPPSTTALEASRCSLLDGQTCAHNDIAVELLLTFFLIFSLSSPRVSHLPFQKIKCVLLVCVCISFGPYFFNCYLFCFPYFLKLILFFNIIFQYLISYHFFLSNLLFIILISIILFFYCFFDLFYFLILSFIILFYLFYIWFSFILLLFILFFNFILDVLINKIVL